MIGITDKISAIIGAICGALVMFGVCSVISTLWVKPAARLEGRASYIAEQAAADKRAELQRKGDNAKLQGMSDYDLCVSQLGRVPECDSLKL